MAEEKALIQDVSIERQSTAERKALLLRLSGAYYEEIAASLGLESGQQARDLVRQAVEAQELDSDDIARAVTEQRLRQLLLGLWQQATKGHQGAVDRVLRILDRLEGIERRELDDPATAFPALPEVPGQEESRSAYATLQALTEVYPEEVAWFEAYQGLRERGWEWRKAALIAWLAMPTNKRWPATLELLARDVLGLKSARTIRKWREYQPEIDLAVEKVRVGILGDRLSDVMFAWETVAAMPDPAAHRDRITYLEWQKVYKGKIGFEVSGEDGGPLRFERVNELADYDDDELGWIIRNLQAAAGVAGLGAG